MVGDVPHLVVMGADDLHPQRFNDTHYDGKNAPKATIDALGANQQPLRGAAIFGHNRAGNISKRWAGNATMSLAGAREGVSDKGA